MGTLRHDDGCKVCKALEEKKKFYKKYGIIGVFSYSCKILKTCYNFIIQRGISLNYIRKILLLP